MRTHRIGAGPDGPAAGSEMRTFGVRSRIAAAALAVVTAGGVAVTVSTGPAGAAAPSAPSASSAARCSDVVFLWARASNEKPGTANLGGTGAMMSRAIRADLPGRSVDAVGVAYAAAGDQSSAGPGGSAMTAQFTALADRCPATRFVLGGGSQGATVTDIALGVRTRFGTGTAIPARLARRVTAVVVIGNPVRHRQGSLPRLAPAYADRTLDVCAPRDSVCDPAGGSIVNHYAYLTNGTVDLAASFAAGCVLTRCTGAGDQALRKA